MPFNGSPPNGNRRLARVRNAWRCTFAFLLLLLFFFHDNTELRSFSYLIRPSVLSAVLFFLSSRAGAQLAKSFSLPLFLASGDIALVNRVIQPHPSLVRPLPHSSLSTPGTQYTGTRRCHQKVIQAHRTRSTQMQEIHPQVPRAHSVHKRTWIPITSKGVYDLNHPCTSSCPRIIHVFSPSSLSPEIRDKRGARRKEK